MVRRLVVLQGAFMRIAIVCSAHGLGHLTRQLAVARALRDFGVEPILFTAACPTVIEEWLPQPSLVPWTVDVGIIQSDSLTEDIPATLAALEQRCSHAAVDRLAAALQAAEVQLVVADAPPVALEAARRAGLPAVAVGNFTWPWIYAHYPALREWGARLALWQTSHPAAALWPGPGMPGFASVESFGLVGRAPRPGTRKVRGHVLVSFGGFGLESLNERLPIIDGITWVLAPPSRPIDRPDCRFVKDTAYPALIAAAEMVLTKPGYGILAETALTGTKLLWVPRGAFPESSYITRVMAERGDRCVDLAPTDAADIWRRRLTEAVTARRADPDPVITAAEESARLAAWLITKTERGALRR